MKFPIRVRLTATFCAAFLVLIALVEAAAYFTVRTAVYSIVDRELQTRLMALDDFVARHVDLYGWPKLRESLKVHPGLQPELLEIRRAGGDVLMQGQLLHRFSAQPFGQSLQYRTFETGSHVLRLLAVRHQIRGQNYDLIMGTDLVVPMAILRRLWLLMLLSAPLLLLAASCAGYWMSGRALAPVADIISAAHSIDSANLSERIAVPDTGDEIQRLAETVNAMLARIEDGFRQIRQFTANASHELRTPLAIIRAAAEVALLRSPYNQVACEDALKRVLREAERNTALLEDMLHLVRADAGLTQFRKERLDLGELMARVCGQAIPLVEAKELRLAWIPPAEPLWIESDADSLHRLFLILLDNAVKYTPQGGRITVTAGSAHGQPFCTVRDTGIGIGAEHLPRIFDRFYRVDKARSRRLGGCGLGLSIASSIAKMHAAEIDVQSEPGRGSSFRVLFPASLIDPCVVVQRPVSASA